MPLSRALICRIESIHRQTSWPKYLALALTLTACSTSPWSQPMAPAPSTAAQVSLSEKCSFVAEMACKAVLLLSGGAASRQRPTCTAFTASNGTRIERCGTAEAEPPATTDAANLQSNTEAATLSWTDNSNNESGFVIERCDQIIVSTESLNKIPACAGEWTLLAHVSPNTTSYVDRTAEESKTYIYRVKAINSSGSSSYSNQALITIPSRKHLP